MRTFEGLLGVKTSRGTRVVYCTNNSRDCARTHIS